MIDQGSTKYIMKSLAAKSSLPQPTSINSEEHALPNQALDVKAPQLTPSVDMLEAFIKQSKPSQDLKHK